MNRSRVQFKNENLPLAVIVAQTRWEEPPRMRHHVVKQLMRWFNVLFVEFFPTTRTDDSLRVVADRLVIYAPQAGTEFPIRWYTNNPLAHGKVNRRYAAHINSVAASLPGELKLLFNFIYDFPEVMQSKLYHYMSYICNDEFPRMQKGPKVRNLLKRIVQPWLFQWYENRVAGLADHCFTPHYPLRDKLQRVNPRVDILFHGHNYEVKTHPSSPRRTGIHVAFAGYIHYRLLDKWLLAVANQKDMVLHLIGPVDRYDLAILKQFANFIHMPALDEDDLFKKLLEMDVLVIPLDPTLPEVAVITTNSKTFQYIASGRPIVISDLPNYIDLPKGLIYRARTAAEFIAQIRRAYVEDCNEYRKLRAEIAMDNTWDKRGDMLFSIIDRDLRGRLSNHFHSAIPESYAAEPISLGDWS
jgi:hypothetical protein